MTPEAPPLTACSDPRREMPSGHAPRTDRIEAALASLAEEQRRLERMGLELPLARCHEQRRYWTFLRALFSMESPHPPRTGSPERSS
jgi:hypothetical protein